MIGWITYRTLHPLLPVEFAVRADCQLDHLRIAVQASIGEPTDFYITSRRFGDLTPNQPDYFIHQLETHKQFSKS